MALKKKKNQQLQRLKLSFQLSEKKNDLAIIFKNTKTKSSLERKIKTFRLLKNIGIN